MREVILLCGPPGAGKTTAARELAAQYDLIVYDRDDPKWISERHFVASLREVGKDPEARAVVIRSCPASITRRAVRALVGATATYLVMEAPETLRQRIVERGRGNVSHQLAGVRTWLDKFDHQDAVALWQGKHVPGTLDLGHTSKAW